MAVAMENRAASPPSYRAVDHNRPGDQAALPAVALVDAETVSREGLPLLVPELRFVATFDSTESLLAARPAADVVILEMHLGGTGGRPVSQRTEAVRSVVEAGYRTCLYTSERNRHLLVACLVAGASGIVHKAEPLDALTTAVLAVAQGRVVITQALVGLAELAERRHLLPSLTQRQRQILSARARGEKFESIGRRLFITKKVAEEHWSIIAKKFAEFLHDHSPADLERLLGLEPGDLVDWPGREPVPPDS